MNLKGKTTLEKQQLTSQYPVLIPGANASGKTTALENLSKEDKERTVVFNFDGKPVGIGPQDFKSVYSIASNKEALEERLNTLPPKAKEYREHIENILATSYFIDDSEAVDKIVEDITSVTFTPSVDRIVLDSFSSMTDFVETWARANFAGREVWANYGYGVQRIQQVLKEATLHGMKFVYVYSHHDFIPAAQYDTTPKQVVAVKGGIMNNNVEVGYNTIIYSHVTEEGKRMFSCDSDSTLDTSRTKLLDSKFSFERTSLDDIELYLNGLATITPDMKLELIKEK